MKKHPFLHLLKAELNGLALFTIAAGLGFAWLSIQSEQNHRILISRPDLLSGNAPFIFSIALFGVFKSQSRSGHYKRTDSLEFYFTRAASRKILFFAKLSTYLFLCLVPLIANLVYSRANPEARTYDTALSDPSTTQYYMTHFEGAHVQKDLKHRDNKHFYTVLPKGRIDRAFFCFVWGCTMALVWQLIFFLFWKMPWAQSLLWASVMLPGILIEVLGGRPISAYERSIVWVNHHPVLVCFGIALLFIGTQAYCCRRFTKTEILS